MCVIFTGYFLEDVHMDALSTFSSTIFYRKKVLEEGA